MLSIALILTIIVSKLGQCTDLVVVYKHSLLLLRDAGSTPAQLPLAWEELQVPLTMPLLYPVGITADPQHRRVFLADVMHSATSIFAISFDDKYQVSSMESILTRKKLGSAVSVIEDMTFNPETNQLLWTDALRHGIFLFNVSFRNNSQNSVSRFDFEVENPRGISVDSLHNTIFWTERSNNLRSVQSFHLETSKKNLLREELNSSIFFQGVTYDSCSNSLLWAETSSDDEQNSSCDIVSQSQLNEPQQLVHLDSCYPFSLTSDQNYVYWADWGQQGLMRASLTNKTDVVKLVHCPQVETMQGNHNGAFGVVILGGKDDDKCNLKQPNGNAKLALDIQNSWYSPAGVVVEDLTTVQVVTLSDNGSLISNEMQTLQNSQASLTETVETNTNLSTNKTPELKSKTATVDDLSIVTNLNSLCSNESELVLIVWLLSLVCFALIVAIVVLLLCLLVPSFRKRCQRVNVLRLPGKNPKIFRFVSVEDSKEPAGVASCHARDNITIDIEDCCQMTLCETPCFTSMKREGKHYKGKQVAKKSTPEDNDNLINHAQ